jgi:CHC2 zinc finger
VVKCNELPAGNRSTQDRRQRSTSRSSATPSHIVRKTRIIRLRVPLLCSSRHSLLTHNPIWPCTIFGIRENTAMPGIDFAQARAMISLADVLDLLGFVPCESSGDQVRGPCPVHHSISPSSRSLSANLKRHIYRCFKCGAGGNQLDLYASATGLSLFEATVALCEKLHREVPWMLSGTSPQHRPADRPAAQPPNRGAGSIPERGQTDRAATALLVPTGLPKWYPL